MNIFTHAEQTIKKYTVSQAVKQALAVLKAKGYAQVCVNAVSKMANDTKITLEEMSDLVEEMVKDTYFYDGWKHQHS